MRPLVWLLLLSFTFLGGCSTTLFESLPMGATTDCDPAWVGRWKALDPKDENAAEAPEISEITADCRIIGKDGRSKLMTLSVIESRAGRFIDVRNESGKMDCLEGDDRYCGHFLVRYEVDGNRIRVYFPDHARISEAIAKGQINGYRSQQPPQRQRESTPVYYNFIAGSPEQITRILLGHPEFFETKPTLELERVADTAASHPAQAPPPTNAATKPATAVPEQGK